MKNSIFNVLHPWLDCTCPSRGSTALQSRGEQGQPREGGSDGASAGGVRSCFWRNNARGRRAERPEGKPRTPQTTPRSNVCVAQDSTCVLGTSSLLLRRLLRHLLVPRSGMPTSSKIAATMSTASAQSTQTLPTTHTSRSNKADSAAGPITKMLRCMVYSKQMPGEPRSCSSGVRTDPSPCLRLGHDPVLSWSRAVGAEGSPAPQARRAAGAAGGTRGTAPWLAGLPRL